MKNGSIWFSSIRAISKGDWDGLDKGENHPLLEWVWLESLESSLSVSPSSGWTPKHLTYWQNDRLIGAVPLYLKEHSFGEFVYDFAFAQAVQSAGGSWYPKLVGMSPLTPSPSYQFLLAPGADFHEVGPLLYQEILKMAHSQGVCSLQFNFLEPKALERMKNLDPELRQWNHSGFLWERGTLNTFSDYLAQFNKNQRRNIKRERQSLIDQGIRLEMVEGTDVPHSWFELMGHLYEKTNDQFGPWAARFLENEFFLNMESLRPMLLFCAAFRDGESTPFALSLLLKKDQGIIGRYWGTLTYIPDLYFNICYYKPIEYALEKGILTFDPGAGSELKLRRGFKAVQTPSLHRFFDPNVGRFFDHYLPQVNESQAREIEEMNDSIPFKT